MAKFHAGLHVHHCVNMHLPNNAERSARRMHADQESPRCLAYCKQLLASTGTCSSTILQTKSCISSMHLDGGDNTNFEMHSRGLHMASGTKAHPGLRAALSSKCV